MVCLIYRPVYFLKNLRNTFSSMNWRLCLTLEFTLKYKVLFFYLCSVHITFECLPVLYRNLYRATRDSEQWNLTARTMYAGPGAWRNSGTPPAPRYPRDDELLPPAGIHCFCSGPPAADSHEVHVRLIQEIYGTFSVKPTALVYLPTLQHLASLELWHRCTVNMKTFSFSMLY
jgi:hypothetical protein